LWDQKKRREKEEKMRGAGVLFFVVLLIAGTVGEATSEETLVVVSEEVAVALREGRPVVALESTIISHGMAWPANLETARAVEAVVREHGAVPATVAILGGRACVGITAAQMERLARAGRAVPKVSRRDIAAVVAAGGDGATTVSATALLAHMAGVRVFVTGGIGGVHRGAEETMDISADLTELGRTPICVVSAGVKSLLDIGRTLEVLETQGVSVVALGTDEFPAFFSRHSGHPAPLRLDTPEQCARLIDANERLHVGSGMLVAVPIPEADEAADGAIVEAAIQKALAEVKEAGIAGRDVTPFILKRVNEITQGASLKSSLYPSPSSPFSLVSVSDTRAFLQTLPS
jgi:pseudouridine-5'-phosphate glycosidase